MQSGPGSNPLTPADQESLRQILKKNDSGGSLSLPSFNVLVTESTDDAEAALKGSSLEEDIGGDREEDVGDFDDVDADVDDEFFDRARNKQTVNPVNIADDSVIDDILSTLQGPADDASETIGEYMELNDADDPSSPSASLKNMFPSAIHTNRWVAESV